MGDSFPFSIRHFSLTCAFIPFLGMTTGCHRGAAPPAARLAEVVVTTPITDEVTDYRDFTGRMDAFMTVDIRPRVSGYVQKALFEEGKLVHEGDLLFQIDPSTYQADWNQAKANLKQAEADRTLQIRKAERERQLIATGAVGKEEYETIVAARDKAIATVGSMEAARDRAKLYLDYTRVVAPITGRISRRLVDPGNLVNADTTILTTVVTEDPMYVYFDVDERTYLELESMTTATSGSWFSSMRFPVLMRLANEEEFTRKGFVNFLDNRLNGNTGTVRMRGVFDNLRGSFKSGLFARVRLPIGLPYKALLIPDEAVQSDQGRKYVFVVVKGKDDKGNVVDKVEYKPVKLGQSIQGLRVVTGELSPSDRVIVSGMQRVRAGSVVQAKMEAPPQAPKSSLTKLLAGK